MNLETNVGRQFLKLMDISFPPCNTLKKIFTRQTVKIGYKCMPNMETAIVRHNCKVLSEDVKTHQPLGCKCDGGVASCPFQGKCQLTGVCLWSLCKREHLRKK